MKECFGNEMNCFEDSCPNENIILQHRNKFSCKNMITRVDNMIPYCAHFKEEIIFSNKSELQKRMEKMEQEENIKNLHKQEPVTNYVCCPWCGKDLKLSIKGNEEHTGVETQGD
jgi:hypothetical protein